MCNERKYPKCFYGDLVSLPIIDFKELCHIVDLSENNTLCGQHIPEEKNHHFFKALQLVFVMLAWKNGINL